ncbi:hypothetical protein [Nocardia sp. NPDC048505]|uniref:hypothetical protein n=1 Tax=unclassified Nocardia TaxID=2637762 RepID=UPI0033EC4933
MRGQQGAGGSARRGPGMWLRPLLGCVGALCVVLAGVTAFDSPRTPTNQQPPNQQLPYRLPVLTTQYPTTTTTPPPTPGR